MILNAMTVDVEDYFQVSAFSNHVKREDWQDMPCRVERNTDRILQLFSDKNVTATFFTLGWVAERYPELVRRISKNGHEIASHGFSHFRISDQEPDQFRADIRRTKRLLEDTAGVSVIGYRAASFSLNRDTLWAVDLLAEEGYLYSSSVYPIQHDHYGMPKAPRFPFVHDGPSRLMELPISTVKLLDRNLPCGGGGYFRLFPYALSRWAIRSVNEGEGRPCVFYFHPWEIDEGQPRIKNIPIKTRFRHYTNLAHMEQRLTAVLADFSWGRLDRLYQANA